MPWRPSRVHLAARRGALDLPLASIRYGADRFPWVVSRGAAMDVLNIVFIRVSNILFKQGVVSCEVLPLIRQTE